MQTLGLPFRLTSLEPVTSMHVITSDQFLAFTQSSNSGNNMFLLMISGKRIIAFPTVGVRTSIFGGNHPLLLLSRAGSTFHNNPTLLTLIQSTAAALASDYLSVFGNDKKTTERFTCWICIISSKERNN